MRDQLYMWTKSEVAKSKLWNQTAFYLQKLIRHDDIRGHTHTRIVFSSILFITQCKRERDDNSDGGVFWLCVMIFMMLIKIRSSYRFTASGIKYLVLLSYGVSSYVQRTLFRCVQMCSQYEHYILYD